jgi:hypothetical protein
MGCGGSKPESGPFYERTLRCTMPAFWKDVSDDAKVDHVFTMMFTPRMMQSVAHGAVRRKLTEHEANLYDSAARFSFLFVPEGIIMHASFLHTVDDDGISQSRVQCIPYSSVWCRFGRFCVKSRPISAF